MAECVINGCNFNEGRHARVLIQGKQSENICRECYEGSLVTIFQNSVLAFFSNSTDTPWKFESPLRRR